MRIYFVSMKDNLNVFNTFLPKRFPTISVHGSNSLEIAVDEIIKVAPVNPFDLVIITNQSSVSEDIESGGKISKKLLDACRFSLKDTPIYFMVPSGGKTYGSLINQNFNAENIRVYYYQGSMKKEDIEAVIKEVAALYEKNDSLSKQAEAVVRMSTATQESIPMGDSYLGKAIVSGVDLNDKLSLLQKFSKNSNKSVSVDPSLKLKNFEEIRSKITSLAKEDLSLDELANPNIQTPTKLVAINEGVADLLHTDAIKASLAESDETYLSLEMVRGDVDSAIDSLKDVEGQERTVIELMTAKSNIINKMAEIESAHVVEVTNEISKVTQEQFQSASSLTKLNVRELDLGSLGNDIKSIEMKKELRDSFIGQVENTAKGFASLMQDVSSSMKGLGESYIKEVKTLQQARLDYANSKGIVLQDASLPVNNQVLAHLQTGYKAVYTDFTSLEQSSKELITSFAKLIHIDTNIINHQTKVIHDLTNTNVKKVINVGSNLDAKSIVVTGKDGVGKTVVAMALAKAFSERGMKTAVIDLDLSTPSLHLYTNTLKVGYELFVKDISFRLNADNLLNMVVCPSVTNYPFDSEEMFISLNNQLASFDRLIYLVNIDSTLLSELQNRSKATVLVTDSNTSNIYDLITQKDSLLNSTPLNTVVINKCSQFIINEVNNLLTPLHLDGIATVPVLYYSKFDYCKLNNIEPYMESAGIVETINQVMSSIE